jgi:hypothetical protein
VSRATAVHIGALRAQAEDAPARIVFDDGQFVGPARIVERLIKQDRINDCTVAVRLETGQVVHLGDVQAVLRAPR